MARYFGHCKICDYVLVNTFITKPKIIYEIAMQQLRDQLIAHFAADHPEKKGDLKEHINISMFNPIPKLERERLLSKFK